MGLNPIKIITHFWGSLIFTIRTCYTSIRDHPFVSVALFILYILHTFLPSVFGYLVTSSPILVCTAVLLGALLNLGNHQKKPEVQQNYPLKITSRSTGVIETGVPVEKDNSICVEPIVGKDRDLEMKGKKVHLQTINGNGLIDTSAAFEQPAKEQPIQKDGESKDSGLMKKAEIQKEEQQIGENIIDQSLKKTKNKALKMETGKKPPVSGSRLNKWVQGSSSSRHNRRETGKKPAVSGSRLNKWVQGSSSSRHNSRENNVMESSDCGSDQAQCSSPLASMAEIIPVLDELHPLLDFQTPQSAAVGTVDESDFASEWSDRSIDGSVDSDEDEEEQGDSREVEEEEKAHESEEEGMKSVVSWTEDDAKNLKELGTLEIERNQRLETLIANRRARKSLSMELEINLIDLEMDEPQAKAQHAQTQAQMPTPIVTARNNNPFDLPFYSNDSGELQPVPSSAPCVLIPKRNPFDLPFEPVEERSNLNVNADNVQQVFLPPVPEKEMYFCRHQSFSWGQTFPDHVEKDKHVIDSRPFLGKKEMEGKGYRPTLQRSMTTKTESKLSCVPEHDSSSSVADEEDENHENLNDEQIVVPQEESERSKDVEPVDMDHVEVDTASSSPSEANESLLHENENEVEAKNLEAISNESSKEASNSKQQSQLPPIEVEVKSVVMEHAEDIPIEDPVYDSSPSASEAMMFEDASNLQISTPRTSSKEKALLLNGSIKNETCPREITEVSEHTITEVGTSEANEQHAASKMPEIPAEVQKVEVKELHPVTPSSSPMLEVGTSEANEQHAASKMPEIPAEVQKVEVKELHPVTPSSSPMLEVGTSEANEQHAASKMPEIPAEVQKVEVKELHPVTPSSSPMLEVGISEANEQHAASKMPEIPAEAQKVEVQELHQVTPSSSMMSEVGISEANEQHAASKMPDRPAEAQKVEVKELHPVTPSSSSMSEVGISEPNEQDAASKMPEIPAEAQKVEVKELHPVTPSSSSMSERTKLSIEKPTVELFAHGDQDLQEFSTPHAVPTPYPIASSIN